MRSEVGCWLTICRSTPGRQCLVEDIEWELRTRFDCGQTLSSRFEDGGEAYYGFVSYLGSYQQLGARQPAKYEHLDEHDACCEMTKELTICVGAFPSRAIQLLAGVSTVNDKTVSRYPRPRDFG